jgi:hypothetical protein
MKYKITAYMATIEVTEFLCNPFISIVMDFSEVDFGDGILGSETGYGDQDGDSSDMEYNDEHFPTDYHKCGGNGDGDGYNFGYGGRHGDGRGHPYM